MNTISILITSDPFTTPEADIALEYCNQAITAGSTITQIFFYQSGVNNANYLQIANSDGRRRYQNWQKLSESHNIPLMVCVTAASKHGVVSAEEAEEQGLAHYSLAAPFQQVGLAEFFTQLHKSSQLVQF